MQTLSILMMYEKFGHGETLSMKCSMSGWQVFS